MSSFALHRAVPHRVAGNCSFYRDLFALIGTIQERDDLCTGAAIGGAERGSGRAVGHAVLHCPCHSASAEGISRHIGKAVDRAGSRAQRTVSSGCFPAQRSQGERRKAFGRSSRSRGRKEASNLTPSTTSCAMTRSCTAPSTD